MTTIGFLGCGNIASAIIKGALSSGVFRERTLLCFDIDPAKAKAFAPFSVSAVSSAAALAKQSDILFLTVKPQVLPAVLKEIKDVLSPETLVVSPVAGVKLQTISASLNGFDRIVRVMPNTPLMVKSGATAICRGAGVSFEEEQTITAIFSACGTTVAVEEEKIDAVTGVSGSSPAFFLRFAKAIAAVGVAEGLTPEQAESLVLQTMGGTAKWAAESGASLDELIRAVASPGGTTEAGLTTMNRLSFDGVATKTVEAAILRSKELSQ